jgi:cytochrome c biogenesis protein CcmG/thiol:disulfide interchange protein DsbE
MKKFIPLIIFAIVLVFLYVGLGKDTKKITSPLIDKPFPDVIMVDYQTGDTYPILKKLKNDNNKWTLVNFWASWCLTCRVEHPMLNKIAKSKKVTMLGVNYKDQKQDGDEFLSHGGNPFDIIAFDHSGAIGLNLGVYAMPESFLVDNDGIIRHKHLGEMTDKIWNEEFLPFIN